MTNALRKTSFIDDLNAAVRENPVAAGLVGAGALWMLFGGAKIPAFATKLASAGTSVGRTAGKVAGGAASSTSEVGHKVTDVLKRAGDRVADTGATVQESVTAGYEGTSKALGGSLSDAADNVTRFAKESGREYGAALRTNLSDTLERQPLVLGAIGLAIGAGIASAFRATSFEKDFVGESGVALREKLEGMASNAAELAKTRAGEVFQAVKEEASAQGLVPDSETLRDVGEKITTVAGAVQEAVKKRIP